MLTFDWTRRGAFIPSIVWWIPPWICLWLVDPLTSTLICEFPPSPFHTTLTTPFSFPNSASLPCWTFGTPWWLVSLPLHRCWFYFPSSWTHAFLWIFHVLNTIIPILQSVPFNRIVGPPWPWIAWYTPPCGILSPRWIFDAFLIPSSLVECFAPCPTLRTGFLLYTIQMPPPLSPGYWGSLWSMFPYDNAMVLFSYLFFLAPLSLACGYPLTPPLFPSGPAFPFWSVDVCTTMLLSLKHLSLRSASPMTAVHASCFFIVGLLWDTRHDTIFQTAQDHVQYVNTCLLNPHRPCTHHLEIHGNHLPRHSSCWFIPMKPSIFPHPTSSPSAPGWYSRY